MVFGKHIGQEDKEKKCIEVMNLVWSRWKSWLYVDGVGEGLGSPVMTMSLLLYVWINLLIEAEWFSTIPHLVFQWDENKGE